MAFFEGHSGHEDLIANLFESTFAASEGADEGRILRHFVQDMMARTAPEDLYVFRSEQAGDLAGCIFFSRMTYGGDPRSVFILSPVAVRSDMQKQGIGQALIRHGLEALRNRDVDVALTYGDPGYYGRCGFDQVSTDTVPAPMPLSQPEGWLAQSLTRVPLSPLVGPARCVDALNAPDLW